MVGIKSAWNTIYNLINNNVSDPENRGKKWIFGTSPDVNAKNFCGYPIIVIYNPEFSEEKLAFLNLRERPLIIRILVITTKAEQLSTLTDSVIQAIENGEASLRDAGLHNFEFNTSSSSVEWMSGGWKRHTKEIELTCRGLNN